MSYLSLNGRSIYFADREQLQVEDYVCGSIAAVVLVGYHSFLWYENRHRLHATLSSHVDFSRISWAKFVFHQSNNKVTIVQNFRSSLMILGFCLQYAVVGISAAARPALSNSQWKSAYFRNLVPSVLLFLSLGNMLLATLAEHYLHFATQIEELSKETQVQFGLLPKVMIAQAAAPPPPPAAATPATTSSSLSHNNHETRRTEDPEAPQPEQTPSRLTKKVSVRMVAFDQSGDAKQSASSAGDGGAPSSVDPTKASSSSTESGIRRPSPPGTSASSSVPSSSQPFPGTPSSSSFSRMTSRSHPQQPFAPSASSSFPSSATVAPSVVEVFPEPLDMDRHKLFTAALTMQCNFHFRLGWRFLSVGLVWILWTVSPVALVVGQVLLVIDLYLNDFSFMYHDRGHVRSNIENQALTHTERLLQIAPN